VLDPGFRSLFDALDRESVDYCVIGGFAAAAYVDPLISLDIDLVLARTDAERAKEIARVALDGSPVSARLMDEARYESFVTRASRREVLDHIASIAAIEDVLDAKVWAASDPARRRSKRHKDLVDISRIIETYPTLRDQVPAEILTRIE
jgi:hypothetical protein